MALEGTYPIIIDGELAGKLTVRTQGARTVFDAVCRKREGIVRISVYGDGTEGRLGVLAPSEDGISLHKTFSRTELKAFPKLIESVERSGRRFAAKKPDMPAAPESEEIVPDCQTGSGAQASVTSQNTGEVREQGEEQGDLFWYASPDGALVCFDGSRSLIALPVGDDRIPPGFGGHRRVVDGKEYLVYITKNGRIVH